MIEIRVLQAHQGDCIWVRCVSEKTVNIVIDVGTSTFKREFKNLVEESIKEVSQKINALSIGELSKEKIALIGEYSSLNEKLINIKILIDRIEEHEKSCS